VLGLRVKLAGGQHLDGNGVQGGKEFIEKVKLDQDVIFGKNPMITKSMSGPATWKESEAEPELETVPEPESEPEPANWKESEAEPELETVPEPESEPEPANWKESEAEPELETVPEPESVTIIEPEYTTEKATEPITEPEAEYATEKPKEPYVPGGGESCSFSSDCSISEICNIEGQCEKVKCGDVSECEAKTDFPVSCQGYFATNSICMKKECKKDTDCARLGENYGCFEDQQCRPKFGKCFETCDCVSKYKMQKGESRCHNGQCFCRTKLECFGVAYIAAGGESCTESEVVPEPAPRQLKPIAGGGESSIYEPKIAENCPKRVKPKYSMKNEKCRLHSECAPRNGLICAMQSGQSEGTCKEVTCSSNEDCTRETMFPTKCMGGHCSVSYCYNDKGCPTGYGCFHDKQCKKIYGSQCNYDCDCSHCPGMECFKDKCFCSSNFENCQVTTVFHSNRGYRMAKANVRPSLVVAGGSAAQVPKKKKMKEDQCQEKESKFICEKGWIKTSKGCYKAEYTSPMTFNEVEAICKAKGSQPVEVISKQIADLMVGVMEMEKIDSAWLGMKGKGDNMKGIYTGRKIDWTPPGFNRTGDEGDCIKAVGRTWVWADCEDKATQFCAQNKKKGKKQRRRRNRRTM